MSLTNQNRLLKPKYLSSNEGRNLHYLKYKEPFICEDEEVLHGIEIAYTTYGEMNADKSNIVWMCHAFTANADPVDWWPGMVGEGKFFDPEKYFIVCANILGSCYGSTGPLSLNSQTNKPYYRSFPQITVRDQVKAHELLRKHLNIDKIYLILGCSIGGHQALEWTITHPEIFENAFFVATNAINSPWVNAFNTSQRMSIEADHTFFDDEPNGGEKGMKAARAIALISYRNRNAYNHTQSENDNEKLDDYRASSYQRYQGDKLAIRFNAYSYYYLTKALDSHNVARGRESVANALSKITAKTLVIGIDTDLLFPPDEQKQIAEHIPNSKYVELESFYGHDGFLLEYEKQNIIYKEFLGLD